MKVEPITRDDAWFDAIDDDIFYAAERGTVESITLARHPDGTWFASVNTKGLGYTAHTYWRVDSDRAALDGVLADGRKRDAS